MIHRPHSSSRVQFMAAFTLLASFFSIVSFASSPQIKKRVSWSDDSDPSDLVETFEYAPSALIPVKSPERSYFFQNLAFLDSCSPSDFSDESFYYTKEELDQFRSNYLKDLEDGRVIKPTPSGPYDLSERADRAKNWTELLKALDQFGYVLRNHKNREMLIELSQKIWRLSFDLDIPFKRIKEIHCLSKQAGRLLKEFATIPMEEGLETLTQASSSRSSPRSSTQLSSGSASGPVND